MEWQMTSPSTRKLNLPGNSKKWLNSWTSLHSLFLKMSLCNRGHLHAFIRSPYLLTDENRVSQMSDPPGQQPCHTGDLCSTKHSQCNTSRHAASHNYKASASFYSICAKTCMVTESWPSLTNVGDTITLTTLILTTQMMSHGTKWWGDAARGLKVWALKFTLWVSFLWWSQHQSVPMSLNKNCNQVPLSF